MSLRSKFRWSAVFAATLSPCFVAGNVDADDPPGAFTLSPASAPGMVLEAVGAGTSEGTPVSINTANGRPEQKWNFIAKGDKVYVIRPSYSTTLALAAKGGASDKGTPVVLETETDKPTELWAIEKNSDGSVGLVPQHAPTMALDDFGGKQAPGSRQDLWEYKSADPHLQWTLTALNSATLPAMTAAPGAPASNIPTGVVKPFTFDTSAIFPGTTRTGFVYIPAQYDGSQPACVLVQQDSLNGKEPPLFDQLIAAKDMPITIGVFISPGTLPGPVDLKAQRRNRCFEYDGISDNYVRFVAEELLPYVATTFHLKLSASGNDRCIVGGSSGGIAAFNAAWQRPDAFSRVYACSGSFTAFRGGNTFPTMIRKFEAKPIRAYFTTGTNDMENCAGDWFLLDQEMDKALKFSGYDYSFHILNGGHGVGYLDQMPDAMRFLWRGWPAQIPEGTSAPRVRDIIVDGAGWEPVAQGYQDARSPACNSKGEIFFVDVPANKIYRIGGDGKVGTFLDDAAHANGLTIGPKDELYTVSITTGKVMSYDALGHGTVVTSGVPGKYTLARPDGSVYVTTAEVKSCEGSRIVLVKDGKATQVDAGLKAATGLAYRPDQWLLTAADGDSKWVYSYEVAADGTLKNKERFFPLHVADWDDDAGPESVCYAQEGQLLVGTRSGVQACADDGPAQVVLPVPDRARVVGVALGGADRMTLFAFCGDKVWKRAVKIHAIGAFSPVVPVKATPL